MANCFRRASEREQALQEKVAEKLRGYEAEITVI
jgi:hypothetical protein